MTRRIAVPSCWLLCLALPLVLLAPVSSAEEPVCSAQDGTCSADNPHTKDDSDEPPILWRPSNPAKCGLYMGPSTLGDATNLGMYAGQDIPVGVNVQRELALPLMFRDWDGSQYYDVDDGSLWDRYIWEGPTADLETYDNTHLEKSKAVFVPGIGCTINSLLDMANVESTHGSTYDTCGLHRRRDPGAGAFGPYHETQTVSTTVIPAGSELFASYGDTWIPEIPGAQVTFDKNLEAAERFLREDYMTFVHQHDGSLSSRVLEGLWNFTRDFPVTQNPVLSVLPRHVSWVQVHPLLEDAMMTSQNNDNQERDVFMGDDNANHGDIDTYDHDTMVTRHFIRQQSKRSMEWLEQHARCSDHIRPGRSTLEQAGRGAFANRYLPQGTIVGYSPLIHIGKYATQIWNIPYGSHEPIMKGGDANYNQDDNDYTAPDTVVGRDYNLTDLVINYSFGHAASTLKLTPYGSMVNYINHHSDPDRINVQIVWPDTELVAHKPEWLTKSVDTLRYTMEKIGLSFDYVATKDIQQGDELFMDYGPAWQAAWERHVQTWKPVPGAESYVHSSQWDHEREPRRTRDELEANPYPPNLETMCVESYQRHPTTPGTWVWLPVLRHSPFRVHCNVLQRHGTDHTNWTYLVEMLLVDDNDDKDKVLRVDQVPHDMVFVVDKVKTADWHMPNAFRHPMAIPDEIMPEAWKNLPAT